MIVIRHQAPTQGEEIVINFIDHMIAMTPHAPTQGEEIFFDLIDIMIAMKTHSPTQGKENFIDMLVHMSVLNKTKHHTMTVINMIAMPTMGVTTNPTTTS